MAFVLDNLANAGNPSRPIKSIASGALGKGAPQIWTYITEDAHTAVDAAGYFNGGVAYGGAYNLLNKGDIIYVVVCAAGAVSTYGPHLVVDKASGTVDVTNVTTGTVTDSD
jgi:hypothetical protein